MESWESTYICGGKLNCYPQAIPQTDYIKDWDKIYMKLIKQNAY